MSQKSENINMDEEVENGSQIDIDVNKKNKSVKINIDSKDEIKGKEEVNVTFSGVHVKSKDGEEVRVNFLPWIIFGVCFVFGIISLVMNDSNILAIPSVVILFLFSLLFP